MEVTATGAGITVPVGKATLGRLFNVLGEAIDDGKPVESKENWCIHREPPSFEEQSPVVEVLETGIKVIDLLAPYSKGGKIGLFGGAGSCSCIRTLPTGRNRTCLPAGCRRALLKYRRL